MRIFLVVLSLLSTSALFAAETRIFLNGMTCPFCAGRVEKILSKIDGYQVREVDIVSIQTGEVIIKTEGDETIPRKTVEKELKGSDYTLKSSKAK